MSDITLSAGVRQNLLSLQNTADLMAKTQNRLATGKKVNTALDNPTSFFTASSLQARSNELSALMDSMSNGVKTLEAADNGLTAITKSLESMQSTLRQARQDKTFDTGTYTLDAARTGNLSFTGGSVGATAVDVALKTDAVDTTLAGAGATFGVDFAGGDVTVNGVTTTIRGDQTLNASTVSGTGGNNFTTGADGNFSTLVGESITLTQGGNTATYTFTAAPGGQAAALEAALGLNGFTTTGIGVGIAATRADGENFTITTSNAAVATAIGITSGTTTTDGVVAFDATAATVAADLSGAVTGLTSTVNGTQVDLALDTGADLTLAGDNTLLTAIGYAGGNRVSTNGTEENIPTLDELVANINANSSLKGKIRATNDSGKLRIENQSTQELTVTGASGGNADGGVGTSTVDGNTVRADLATQYNELRDQLDKLSDDASYNGVNLLRGDNLKLTFNETNTSTIDIQIKNGETMNAAYLDISDLVAADLDDDSNIDTLISTVKSALHTVRSQSSAFGSNLSIVENRKEFTTSMMNTLQTGADGLILADGNEEAANMLALQTRQQLSSTALSLASQADQAPLSLF